MTHALLAGATRQTIGSLLVITAPSGLVAMDTKGREPELTTPSGKALEAMDLYPSRSRIDGADMS